MVGDLKLLPARFYRLSSGAEPVRVWLKSLPRDDRYTVGVDIRAVECGWPIGLPVCRPLGGGLWEVRSNLTQKRTSRVIFCVAQGNLVLLHAFLKKTQKTPAKDLNIARKRQKEVEQ
jgi:phage-related protein